MSAFDNNIFKNTLNNHAKDEAKAEIIMLNKNKLSMHINSYDKLYCTVCPKDLLPQELEWSSSNPNIATVDAGEIHAISEGTAVIEVKIPWQQELSAKCHLKVTLDILPYAVEIVQHHFTLRKNHSCHLNVKVFPDNAANKDVFWHSCNPDVATVSAQSGIIYGHNIGTAFIIATSCEDEDVYNFCILKVI